MNSSQNVTVGSCPHCRSTNSRKAIQCLDCRARLPWADEAEKEQSAQKVAAAASAIAAAPAKGGYARDTRFADADDYDLWWQAIGVGVFFLLLAGYFYWSFTTWETEGGIRRMRWYLALAYQLGGKWPIISIFSLLGVGGIAFGIMDYWKRHRN